MNDDRKRVLITDLDNTLFDWVDLWHACFMAMMGKVVEISGIPFDDLKPEIRKVHQRHGTSEYSFLLEELPSLSRRLTGKSAADVFQPAIEAYRAERRRKLVQASESSDSIAPRRFSKNCVGSASRRK